MKKLLSVMMMALLTLSVLPMVFAVATGLPMGVDVTTEDSEPEVWMCGSRTLLDDMTSPGRLGGPLFERVNNYAFEGESVSWEVLVMDVNGEETIDEVVATIGDDQGVGGDREVTCQSVGTTYGNPFTACGAVDQDGQGITAWDWTTMRAFTCTLTVETADSMYGEYWVTVEAEDLDGLMGAMAENEYWYFNPEIGLSVDGDLTFEDVRPGTPAYSPTLLVENDADDDSGVQLDMFISGTDFYDTTSSSAMCPTTNMLALSYFRYFVTDGAYSSLSDGRSVADPLNEGYIGINYGTGFNDPNPFYGTFNGDFAGYEIMQGPSIGVTFPYFAENLLTAGDEMALTFRLDLPEPCNGDFDSGQLYFWGEAI